MRNLRKRLISLLTVTTWVVAFLFLSACASSDLSRHSATEVDNVYNNAKKVGNGQDPVGAYRNASQEVKGALIGGAAGAIVGSMSTTVGVLPGTIGGAVFGAAIGAYIDSQTDWQDRLNNAGGQVIILGDQVRIILPSAMLFNSMTSDLNASAYPTLDKVAELLRSLDKVSVKVSAYTNATGPARVNQEISQAQADSVARYLWSEGVNARLMSAVGYGGTHLVRQNSYDWNENENYRVEITVEKL